MACLDFFATIMNDHPLVVLLFFCWFTFANFSPVNGFLVVGVVIVLFWLPFELSLYLALSLDQIRVLSNGISSVDVIGSPSTGPYFVTSSTGGVTTSLSIFNSWFTWNVLLATFRFGSNSSLWPGLISSPPYSVISSTGCFVTFLLLVHLRQLFPC